MGIVLTLKKTTCRKMAITDDDLEMLVQKSPLFLKFGCALLSCYGGLLHHIKDKGINRNHVQALSLYRGLH